MLGGELSILGLNSIISKFSALGSSLPGVVASALYEEASNIMDKSLSLVPVDTGALRSTGHVELPVIDGNQVKVELGYGGPAGANGMPVGAGRTGRTPPASVGYATIVHERMDVNHPVGQAKYLEQPLMEAIPEIPTNVGAALAREVGGLGLS